MRAVAQDAALAGGVRVLALLLAAYLVVGQPVVGWWSARRQLHDSRPDARRRRYLRTTLLEWALAAAALVLVLVAPGLDVADLGVAWPRASAYTVVGGLGLVLSVALLIGLRRRVDRGARVIATAEVDALLPRTAAERRGFARLALTAGVCEEVLYRGFLLAVLVAEAPELGPWRLVLVSALAFAVAHTYQGVTGILTAGVLGGGFAVLFLGTGSLLLPVLYHALIDLRLLVLSVRTPRHRAGGPARTFSPRRPAGPARTFSPRPPPGDRADSPRGPA